MKKKKGFAPILALVLLFLFIGSAFVVIGGNQGEGRPISDATTCLLKPNSRKCRNLASPSPSSNPSSSPSPILSPSPSGPAVNASPIPVKVMVVIYNPIIESQGGKKLTEVKGWNNPDTLTNQLIFDFSAISHGVAQYQISQRIERDEWPVTIYGTRYTDESYFLDTSYKGLGPGDYNAIINDNQIAEKVNAGTVDEVWLWGFPGTGWCESTMAGKDAYFVNCIPVSGILTKRFILMGFNYERGMPEAFESYGHRTEFLLLKSYGETNWSAGETSDFKKFRLLDVQMPGHGGVGDAHEAVNANPLGYNRTDLDYVSSSADDWLNFPNMTGARRNINCTEWNCDGYQYLKWWYRHMPHVTGTKNNILNNWWAYILNPSIANPPQ